MTRTEAQQFYADENPLCEVHLLLKKNHQLVPHVNHAFQECLAQSTEQLGVHVHHIFKGQKRRPDVLSNMISVSPAIHLFYCEGRLSAEATILCLAVKLRKGELDIDEIAIAAGFHLEGWLTLNRPGRTHWTKPLWDELMKFVDEAEDG